MNNLVTLVNTFLLVLLVSGATAQARFDPAVYTKFLQENKGLTVSGLMEMYPAGVFRLTAPVDETKADWFDAVNHSLTLTPYERFLLSRHSFVVTERLSYPDFNAAFYDVYSKDLPLYISSDAILHAMHRTYSKVLKNLELTVLMHAIGDLLSSMHGSLRTVAVQQDELVRKAVNDADIFLTVGRRLLQSEAVTGVPCLFPSNESEVSKLLGYVNGYQPQAVSLFGTVPRIYDFSQMKPRGHYAESNELSRYFRAVMWLSRTEVYLTKPQGVSPPPTDEDIRRQCMLAVLLGKTSAKPVALKAYSVLDNLITAFVGKQDNLTLPHLKEATEVVGITEPSQLLSDQVWHAFQDSAIARGADQLILSQILIKDPFEPGDIKPAGSFMLLGQRFIPDSYILANVVFDKVAERMMPDPADAVFALGNDAVLQLLVGELERFGYSPNLAGLRFLMSSLDDDFWQASLYGTWLNAIRELNPPPQQARRSLPLYMQTAAWWQKTLNTQLSSWAELRHDNLLYAKQSYTGGVGCYYPAGYVEPFPHLYEGVARFARAMGATLESMSEEISSYADGGLDGMIETLIHIDTTCRHLALMSKKELDGISLSTVERSLIDNWITMRDLDVVCAVERHYNGIYPRLMYDANLNVESDPDYVIADIHTQPTDEAGAMVGRVLHIGTGQVNLGIFITTDPADGCMTTYAGPVSSYHQYITNGFERLTDQEWSEMSGDHNGFRPPWVNNYLASSTGGDRGSFLSLVTDVSDERSSGTDEMLMSIAPNPATDRALVSLTMPAGLSGQRVTMDVLSIAGHSLFTIASEYLGTGTFVIPFDVSRMSRSVSSGSYLLRVQAGDYVKVLPFRLIR